MAVLRCRFSLGSIVCGAVLDDRGWRWSGFVLPGDLVELSSHAWPTGAAAESCLVGRCYARQFSQNLRVWTDEHRAVALFGAVVGSTDVRTGKYDMDLSPEDGSVDR
ncbi:Serine/threonine-protein kinase HT1 [Hordeum vulgare]|nr:Serine/threonine-protein kinase HT1 [Hordeum vulgare]